MAEHYVALLLEVQPQGPYFLAGHSFGGLVAFAMAQILLAQGQTIGLLAIVDTYAPGALKDDTAPVLNEEQILFQVFQELMPLAQEDIEGLSADEQLVYVAHRLEKENLWPEEYATDHLRCLLNVFKASIQMHIQYSPEFFLPLPIALFRADEPLADQPAEQALGEDWGWGRCSSQPVPVSYVPGNHQTMMMPPHVGILAQVLGRYVSGGVSECEKIRT